MGLSDEEKMRLAIEADLRRKYAPDRLDRIIAKIRPLLILTPGLLLLAIARCIAYNS